jgi:hypothetical protein
MRTNQIPVEKFKETQLLKFLQEISLKMPGQLHLMSKILGKSCFEKFGTHCLIRDVKIVVVYLVIHHQLLMLLSAIRYVQAPAVR